MKYCPECASELIDKFIDGKDRKVCSLECGFVHWDNPTPVVAALVEYEGKIILARNAKWPHGVFSLITGFLEKNETPEQSIEREVKEELNLETNGKRFLGHYYFLEMNQIIIAFGVAASGDLTTNDEIAEVKLISRELLRSYNFGRLYLTTKIVNDWLEKTRL